MKYHISYTIWYNIIRYHRTFENKLLLCRFLKDNDRKIRDVEITKELL